MGTKIKDEKDGKDLEISLEEKQLKELISSSVKEIMTEKKELTPEELEEKALKEKKAVDEKNDKAVTKENVQKMIEGVLSKIVTDKKIKFPSIIKEKGEGKRSFAECLKAVRYRNEYLLKKYSMQYDPTAFGSDEKIMIEGVGAQGGFLVPPEFVQQIIDESLVYEVVKPLCTNVPMAGLTKTWPVLLSGSAAYWIDENGKKTESTPVWGQFTLRNFKCCTLVKVSDEELEDSDPAADQFLVSNFADVIGNEIDRSLLVGTGGVGDPIVGILNQPGINIIASGAALDFDDVFDAISAAKVAGAKNLAIIINPRDENTFRKLKGADGQYLWTNASSSMPATIGGYPVYMDGNIPTNLGVGLNESIAIVAEFKKAFVGNKAGLVISNGLDGEDFSFDRTSFRAVQRLAFGIPVTARPKFSAITGILP